MTYGNDSRKVHKTIHHAVPGRIFITLVWRALPRPSIQIWASTSFYGRATLYFLAIFLYVSKNQTPLFYTQNKRLSAAVSWPQTHHPCTPRCSRPRHVVRLNSNWQGAILGVAQKNALTHTHTAQAHRANLVGALKVAAP
jgi:hypothetical protein